MDKPLTKHLTDDQVLEFLYAGAIQDAHVAQHLATCSECRQHVNGLFTRRSAIEHEYRAEDDVPFEFLAAQRREIYARLDLGQRLGWFGRSRYWAVAAGLSLALTGGFAIFEQRAGHKQPQISDAQLASEVGQFAEDATPQPAQPIRALFEE